MRYQGEDKEDIRCILILQDKYWPVAVSLSGNVKEDKDAPKT
jgi:hypothetical protein